MKKLKLYIETSTWNFVFAEDALHVAVATLEELDAVVTWNHKHLANIRKAELFFGVNLEQGSHKKVEIITPWEVIGHVES